MRKIVLTLTLLSLAFTPAPFHRPERRGNGYARLQGVWIRDAVYLSHDGSWVKSDAFDVTTLVVRGPRFAWVGDFAPSASVETFALHDGPYPRGIDFFSREVSGAERAAYAIKGDTLTIVLPFSLAERPTLERGRIKLVYHRQR